MLHYVIYAILISNAMSISSPGPLTRYVGQDVVFMFNASNIIDAFNWGIRDGNTNDLKQGLIKYKIGEGMQHDKKINSTSYAGRVSFVGDLSKGQAWFKITNLNINDTNQYMARIFTRGASGYSYAPAQLTVIIPTTSPPTTCTPMTSLKSSSLSTQDLSTLPTATSKPTILKNLTTTLEVDETFSQNMTENTSPAFKKFANEFQAAITSAYTNLKDENFESVNVTQLREGSIVVTFVVYFKNEITLDKACAPIENAIKNGKLGSFEIVPGSLRCSKEKPSSPRPPAARTGIHPGIIAGVAVAGVLAIAGLVIVIIYVCRKKGSRKDYRSSRGRGQGQEMETKYGEPEEHYASIQRQNAQAAIQSHEDNPPLPQYAVVDKNKIKKKTKEPGELIYAQLDHEFNANMGARPLSDRRSTGEKDTVYADLQDDKPKKRYPPPQYGNVHDMNYA